MFDAKQVVSRMAQIKMCTYVNKRMDPKMDYYYFRKDPLSIQPASIS